MNKYEIDIDLSNLDNLITVIIGKMGSGKTTILGHLQPFANYGTIDIRNGDDQIIEGKDGLKQLYIEDNETKYVITHKYIANKDKHSTKSYITKNGEELNPNGNQSSFKTMIELEFEIDQTYLVLMRLGSNVQNLINMTSTERKKYIANLLTEVEFYALLNKTLREDHRKISAHMDVLGNRLSTLSHHKSDDMESELRAKTAKCLSCESARDEIKEKIHTCIAEQYVALNKRDLNSHKQHIRELGDIVNQLEEEIKNDESNIETLSSEYNIDEINRKIGSLQSNIFSLKEEIIHLDNQYQQESSELRKVNDKIAMIQNNEQMTLLQDKYNDAIKSIEEFKKRIEGFECKQNSLFIKNLLIDLEMFGSQLNDLLGYNKDTIYSLYKSDSTILKYAANKIEALNAYKYKLQRSINNIKFLVNYVPEGKVYTPPMCPTVDRDAQTNYCPYYKTHPVNQPDKTEKEYLKELSEIENKIQSTDVEIYKFSDYPMIYNRLVKLKISWKDIKSRLNSLDVLRVNDLLDVLRHPENQFYSHKKLMEKLELCEKREKYYSLTEKIQSMRAELNEFSKYDFEYLSSQRRQISGSVKEIKLSINTKEDLLNKAENELKNLDSLYYRISSLEELKINLKNKKESFGKLESQLIEMNQNLSKYYRLEKTKEALKSDLNSIELDIISLTKSIRELESTLKDIDYTTKEYKETAQKEMYLKYMIEASSSKNGLPLIFVKRFISTTKDTINDMLYEVFNGSIEIIDFEIQENDFSIPYYTNGTRVDDITKASQGEQSIISIALSFALMQRFMKKWNIPLLDEVDGPLYKSDRNKFLSILFKHINLIRAEQVFIISHNDTFSGYPVNIIMTTEEVVDNPELVKVIKVN